MRRLLQPRRWALAVALAVVLVLVWPGRVTAAPVLPSPAGWPLAGASKGSGAPPVVEGFAPPATRYGAGHRGVDLLGEVGQPVLAAAAGTVSFAGQVGGHGVVTIDHGGVSTTYEPVDVGVGVGQRVELGQRIGRLAAGGHCGVRVAGAEACLHWGLKQGATYLNPLLLVGGDHSGELRLLAGDRRAVVTREAAAREAAERRTVAAAADTVAHVSSRAGPAGSHGFLHPVPGPITSPYGMRLHPVLHRWKLHDGTDFGAPCGTPIRAAYDGRVTATGDNVGYGNRLFIDHGRVHGVGVVTAYNHAARYVVGVGRRVRRGQVIGYVGNTGFTTGCHLHLMIWLDGAMVNPMTWL